MVISQSELEKEERDLDYAIKKARKELKPQSSFSSEFWSAAAGIENLRHQKALIQRKISTLSFPGTMAEWEKTEAAAELFQEMKATEVGETICKRQSKVLSSVDSIKKATQQSFIKLFITSSLGLGITNTGAGRRDSSQQSRFRSDLIEVYNAKHPRSEYIWCPIFGDYFPKNATTAAHLFAYKHGQETMDAIFGPTSTSELFSPRNGLLVNTSFEEVFDIGFLAIVPFLPDNPSPKELSDWASSDPKEYKVRIIDWENKNINTPINKDGSCTWRDFDGKRLEFLNHFRPRARYLYFHYCLQILRLSWRHAYDKSKVGEAIRGEIGKSYWGTTGRYLPKYMLFAFVEAIGQKWEHLIENGIEGEEKIEGDRYTLLSTATSHITQRKEDDKSDDEDDSDDDDNMDE